MKIKNLDKLIPVGDIVARRVVSEIIELSLQSLDAYHTLKNFLNVDGNILKIGDLRWDLEQKRRLLVIGAGKASGSMAKAVEETLGDRINGGLVIVKELNPGDKLKRIELVVGGHPLPNKEGLLGSKRILSMVEQATSEDLFISVISGGGSALMSCPAAGISLEDEIRLTDLLLRSGARILEINAVRRHISATNGGRLAQKIEAKGAEMINLIISDTVGDRPTTGPVQPTKFYGTPVAGDKTTLQDARNVLKKYHLILQAPRSIVEFLRTEDPGRETPKLFGSRIRHFVLQRPADACESAKKAASNIGLSGSVLTTLLEGESREAGTFLATIAKEIALNHRPFVPPCVLIAGGETTTRVDDLSGQGGPSQELALGFALEISGMAGLGIAAIDTDGTDGPTEIAGGIADGSTLERARLKGSDVYERLSAHDSSTILKILGDEIITGNTGTNVCDLNVIYIS